MANARINGGRSIELGVHDLKAELAKWLPKENAPEAGRRNEEGGKKAQKKRKRNK